MPVKVDPQALLDAASALSRLGHKPICSQGLAVFGLRGAPLSLYPHAIPTLCILNGTAALGALLFMPWRAMVP